MNWDIPVAIAAVYASLLSTAVLVLELRRWAESGPRLSVRAYGPMITINVPHTEGKEFLSVSVTNRGGAPTTITNMIVFEYPNRLARWRNKPSTTGIIANPAFAGQPFVVPSVLRPGEMWTGYADYDQLRTKIIEGRVYAGIYASHSDRPILDWVRPPRKKPKELVPLDGPARS